MKKRAHEGSNPEPVNVRYARQNFRKLIDEVADGSEVTLLRRGEAVARLVGVEPGPRRLPSLAEFRHGLVVGGRPLSEDIVRSREQERY